jgi:hypothetical protein
MKERLLVILHIGQYVVNNFRIQAKHSYSHSKTGPQDAELLTFRILDVPMKRSAPLPVRIPV